MNSLARNEAMDVRDSLFTETGFSDVIKQQLIEGISEAYFNENGGKEARDDNGNLLPEAQPFFTKKMAEVKSAQQSGQSMESNTELMKYVGLSTARIVRLARAKVE